MAALVCRECGIPIKRGFFCGAPHRKAWHNRRMVRGMELYDLVMEWRINRPSESSKAAYGWLSNLPYRYHESDKKKRNGRPSWNFREAVDRLPFAYSTDGDGR